MEILNLDLEGLRKARNKTIAQMAEELGISSLGYRNKEKGVQPLSIDEKMKICEILDVKLNFLYPEDAERLKKLLD